MPLLDRILIQPDDASESTSTGGVILPETMQTAVRTGHVVAVGPGRVVAGVGLVPVMSKQGDLAFYTVHSGVEILLNGTRFRMLNESEILALSREGAVTESELIMNPKVIGKIPS